MWLLGWFPMAQDKKSFTVHKYSAAEKWMFQNVGSKDWPYTCHAGQTD